MAANDFCIFLVGSDEQLYMRWRDNNGVWSGGDPATGNWDPLGGSWPSTSVPCAGILNGGGDPLAVFLVGQDSQLYWRTKDASNWSKSWYPLGGGKTWPSTSIPVLAYGIPWGVGLTLYMVGQDGQLYYAMQQAPSLSNFQPIGFDAKGRPWPKTGTPALGYYQSSGTNYATAYMLDVDGNVEFNYYIGNDGSGHWAGWSQTNYKSYGNMVCIEYQVFIIDNAGNVQVLDSRGQQGLQVVADLGPVSRGSSLLVPNLFGLNPYLFAWVYGNTDIGFYPGPDPNQPQLWGDAGQLGVGCGYTFITGTPDGYVAIVVNGGDQHAYFMSWKDRTWINLGGAWPPTSVPCCCTTVE